MWIRTQDETKLIEVTQIERTGLFISCNKWQLGKYETSEQAKEVMDMIEDHMNDIKNGHQEVFQMPEESDIKYDLSGVTTPSRPNNTNQDNCSINEGIKQVHMISRYQLKILISILNRNIESLENGFVDNVIFSLKALRRNLRNNLGGEKIERD